MSKKSVFIETNSPNIVIDQVDNYSAWKELFDETYLQDQKEVLGDATDFFSISLQEKSEHPVELQISSQNVDSKIVIGFTLSEAQSVEVIEHINALTSLDLHVFVFVNKHAQITYTSLQRGAEKDVQHVKRKAYLYEHASITWNDIQVGSRKNTASIENYLMHDYAEANTYGIFSASKHQEYDLYHATHHIGKHTKSILKTRGVIDDNARVTYRSLINIEKTASGAQGKQKERTISLSKDATIYAIPDLDAKRNDISCSHGVSTRSVDSNTLFYLQSRGIERKEAINHAIHAHVDPILSKIPISIQPYVSGLIRKEYAYE